MGITELNYSVLEFSSLYICTDYLSSSAKSTLFYVRLVSLTYFTILVSKPGTITVGLLYSLALDSCLYCYGL